MNMMNWEILPTLNHYSKHMNDKWNQLVTELESFFGRVSKDTMDSGLDSILKFLQKRKPPTIIKFTSEPNTTTILMTWTHPPSSETCSNTTTQTFLLNGTEDGSSKGHH